MPGFPLILWTREGAAAPSLVNNVLPCFTPGSGLYTEFWIDPLNNNKDHCDDIALVFLGKKITYKELLAAIDQTAAAFSHLGIKRGDVVKIQSLSIPQVVYTIYALSKIGAVANLIFANANG